jgi:hypothetical protein
MDNIYTTEEFKNTYKTFCIAIASHISSAKRIQYLVECLKSLLSQTVPIDIYLSISFESKVIHMDFLNAIIENKIMNNPYFHLVTREEKTPQMRHFYLLMEKLKKHKWVMFCDDDDTYDKARVENIVKSIYIIDKSCNSSEKIFSGLYESHCEKDHREHRHEYWCYCVNICVMERFYEYLKDYPDIIDNKCCDVLFGEFIRRLGLGYFFGRLDMRLYNYRVTENQDSITGVIQARQSIYTKKEQHPPLGSPELTDYIIDWNEYLYKHMDVYLHDVFLRSIVGCDMEYILKSEFLVDYDLVPFIDECHVKKMRDFHEYLRGVCNIMFDIKL